jgi:hypothetical protein
MRALHTTLAFLALLITARAQLPEPYLNSVFPGGGQSGTNIEIAVKGENLDDPEQLLFSHPGIKGEMIESKPTTSGKTWKQTDGFKVSIAPDVPPGVYVMHVVGKFGLSNTRLFVVSSQPEIREGDLLERGVIFNGRSDGNGKRDFKLGLKTGEWVSVLCEAGAIDSKMEPALSLTRPDGSLLGRVVGDIAKREARLEFTAETDGEYVLSVWDYVFRGGNECAYRLQWGNKAPESLGSGQLLWPEGAVNATHSGSGSGSHTFNAKKGQVFWLDVVSERLGLATDFTMKVMKGDAVVATADDATNNVAVPRLPLSTRDPSLRFVADEDAEYRVVLQDQFVAMKGDYHLIIRDVQTDFELLALVSNPYDDGKQSWDANPILRRNGALVFDVFALRRNGFDGEIALSVDGLPTGVALDGETIIPAGGTWGTITLRGEQASENWVGPIVIRGRVGDVERTAHGVRLASKVGDYQNEGPINCIHEGHLLKVLAEEIPLQVNTPTDKVFVMAVGGVLEIPFAVNRTAGVNFKNGIAVRPVEFPGMKNAPETKIDDKASEGVLKLSFVNQNNNKFESGVFRFKLRADATLAIEPNKEAADAVAAWLKEPGLDEEEKKILTEREKSLRERAKARDVKFSTWSPPVTVILSDAPLEVVSVSVAPEFEAGKSGEVKFEVNRMFGFADEIDVIAEPPAGITATPVKMKKEESASVMTLAIAPEVAPNDYRATLRFKMKFGGQEVSMVQEILVHVIAAKEVGI